jgi:hypothetical protein
MVKNRYVPYRERSQSSQGERGVVRDLPEPADLIIVIPGDLRLYCKGLPGKVHTGQMSPASRRLS